MVEKAPDDNPVDPSDLTPADASSTASQHDEDTESTPLSEAASPATTTAIVLVSREPRTEAAAAPPIIAAMISWPIHWIIWPLVIGLLLLGLVGWLLGGARLLFITQMSLLLAAICATPSLAYIVTRQRSRILRVFLETFLFAAVLILFGVWLLGAAVLGGWIGYAVALFLILETGAQLLERHLMITLRRMPQNVHIEEGLKTIKKSFYSEWVLYISVPVGFIMGTITGLIRGWTTRESVVFCIEEVLILACVVLLLFLVYAFVQMSDPLLKTAITPTATIVTEPAGQQSVLLRNLVKVFRLIIPSQKLGKELQEQQDLLFAFIATDLRKIYFYDSVHNTILLVAFGTTLASLSNIPLEPRLPVIAILVLGLIFNQLPFVVGQSFLHERLLDRYEGLERVDLADKLKKYAPLFPATEFFAALFATGTAGGLIFYLIQELLKGIIK